MGILHKIITSAEKDQYQYQPAGWQTVNQSCWAASEEPPETSDSNITSSLEFFLQRNHSQSFYTVWDTQDQGSLHSNLRFKCLLNKNSRTITLLVTLTSITSNTLSSLLFHNLPDDPYRLASSFGWYLHFANILSVIGLVGAIRVSFPAFQNHA